MGRLLLSLLFISLLGYGSSSNPDDSLPVYLRGIGWNEVQKHLKHDLRLSDDVVPVNYLLELAVNVRGHAGAKSSDFNGTVTISLNITKPVDKIELHSNGLIIEKAQLIGSAPTSKPVGVVRVSSDSDRETTAIHTNRMVLPNESLQLQITYRGVAKMDEYGLYENWDPKLNKSLDSHGPFILASRNFPTGARYWFPCFDEPEKKAAFELRINHPSRLNAYSNANLKTTESLSNSRTLSVFEKTRPLATYEVALSVNHYPVQSFDVKGFKKVQLIQSNNSHDGWSSLTPFEKQRSDPSYPDLPVVLKQNLELLSEFAIGEAAHKETLNIIFVEGAYSLTVQPGLITIGRYNFWRIVNKRLASQELKNLAQVHVGNHLSVRSTTHMWLNDMFSYSLPNDTYWELTKNRAIFDKVPDETLHSSLHERALGDVMTHATSTEQYLVTKNELPSLKAADLLRLLTRFCFPAEAAQKYFADHIGGFTDIEFFIANACKFCSEPNVLRKFLQDYIYQPGKALLSVRRNKTLVTIEQTRYHSTYFNQALRDNKTRYTIPILYSVDGHPYLKYFNKEDKTLTIFVPESSLFLIDHTYDHLYFVYYENFELPRNNFTEEERITMFNALLKGMVAATSIGFAKYKHIEEQRKNYTDMGIFRASDEFAIETEVTFFVYGSENEREGETPYHDDAVYDKVWRDRCEKSGGYRTSWDGMFNNETKYWEDLLVNPSNFVEHMHCMAEWNSSAKYQRFLEDNFLGENTVIRPNQMENLAQRSTGREQWMDLHRFFFRNAANFTNHRFDMLADTVLNQAKVRGLLDGIYPSDPTREDYVKELREFVRRNPRRAASMSNAIEMRLEKEYVRENLMKWHSSDLH